MAAVVGIPARFSYRQLEEIWIAAGGKPVDAPTAAAIALAESNGVPTAVGHNTNGSVDRGLWQINSVWGRSSSTDIVTNAKAAVWIHEHQGWHPWTTYKTGAFEKFQIHPPGGGLIIEKGVVPQSGLAAPILGLFEGKLKVPGFSSEGKAEQSATGALEHPGSILEGVGKLVLTGVLLLAGAVLAIYGIMIAVRPRESAFSIPLGKVA